MATQINDFYVEKDDEGVFDLVIENNQFKTLHSFDTALQMVLLADRRASADEIPTPNYRRGWWANQFLNSAEFEIGSKVWLFEQVRRTQETINKLVDVVKQGCQWIIDDGHAKSIEVRGESVGISGVRVYIDITLFNNRIESKYYDLWHNTGKRSIIDGRAARYNILLETGEDSLFTEDGNELAI